MARPFSELRDRLVSRPGGPERLERARRELAAEIAEYERRQRREDVVAVKR